MFDWLSRLDEKVLAALIGGGAGLVVTLLNHLLGPLSARATEKFRVSLLQDAELERTKLQQQLTEHAESLKNRHQRELDVHRQALTESSGAVAARRDYEYEARKRLYTEVEPLLFQLHESLEEAHYRVKSLARTSRKGSLSDGRVNWLRGDGYYLRSTLYKLMLPAVHFRLMQRCVTFVDMSRPVLSRLLITQACLAHVILSVYHSVATIDDLVQRLNAFAMSADAANQLSWTGSPEHPQELLVALEYGSERLRWLSSPNLA